MTWYEIEQIASYICDLESSLEDWTLNNIQMRSKLAELNKIADKLKTISTRRRIQSVDPILNRAIDDLNEHIQTCNRNLRERLIT